MRACSLCSWLYRLNRAQGGSSLLSEGKRSRSFTIWGRTGFDRVLEEKMASRAGSQLYPRQNQAANNSDNFFAQAAA